MAKKEEKAKKVKNDSKQRAMMFGDLTRKVTLLIKKANTKVELEECVDICTQCITLNSEALPHYQMRARAFFLLEQYQRSLFDYTMAVRMEPQNARNLAARSACYRKLGRFEEALQDISDSVKAEKDNASFYFQRAEILMDQENYSNAIIDLNFALDYQAGSVAKFLLARGNCYMHTNKLDDAIADYKRALEADRTLPDTFANLGRVYVLKKDYKEALNVLSGAIEHAPRSATLRFLRGSVFVKLHEYSDAIEDLSIAISIDDSNSDSFFSRGVCHFQVGQLQSALTDFDAAIARNPRNANYLHYKGLTFEKLEIPSMATAAFEAAVVLDPNVHESRLKLAASCFQGGDLRRALELVTGWQENSSDFFRLKGEICFAFENFQEAENCFSQSLIFAETANTLFLRGQTRTIIGAVQSAVADLSRSLEICNDPALTAQVRDARGSAFIALGELGQAETDFSASVEISSRPDCLARLARCRASLGKLAEAEDDLNGAIFPGNFDAFYTRGLVRFAREHYSGALEDLEISLQILPAEKQTLLPDISYHCGVCHANAGNIKDAVSMFTSAIEVCTNRPHYYHERAKALQAAEQHDRALEDFNTVLTLQPGNCRAMFRRGFSLKALGRMAKAAEDFEFCRQENSNPRMFMKYEKIPSAGFVSLGPAGFENPHYSLLSLNFQENESEIFSAGNTAGDILILVVGCNFHVFARISFCRTFTLRKIG